MKSRLSVRRKGGFSFFYQSAWDKLNITSRPREFFRRKNLGEKRILFGEIDEVGRSEPYSCCYIRFQLRSSGNLRPQSKFGVRPYYIQLVHRAVFRPIIRKYIKY